jgi:hypothetical protein
MRPGSITDICTPAASLPSVQARAHFRLPGSPPPPIYVCTNPMRRALPFRSAGGGGGAGPMQLTGPPNLFRRSAPNPSLSHTRRSLRSFVSEVG